MILRGTKIDIEASEPVKRVSTNISQMILFNSVRDPRNSKAIHLRNSTTNEPPLPVEIGLRIHSATRSKKLIQVLHKDGLSISYDRVLAIRHSIAASVCKKYSEKGFVTPTNLLKNEFISIAIDNIDQNLQSSTATSSVHWTSMSVFQHPKGNRLKENFKELPLLTRCKKKPPTS